jgi:hypothetical protein
MIFLIDIQNGRALTNFIESLNWNSGIGVLVAGAAGFVAGNFLDALRDRIDAGLDRLGWRIEWKFLTVAADDQVKRVDDFYFASYVLSANLVISAFITAVVDLCYPVHFASSVWWLLLAAVVVFGADAICLRSCIVKDSKELFQEAAKNKRQ